MMKQKLFVMLMILMVLAAATTLTRCGKGLGPAFSANANSAKY